MFRKVGYGIISILIAKELGIVVRAIFSITGNITICTCSANVLGIKVMNLSTPIAEKYFSSTISDLISLWIVITTYFILLKKLINRYYS